METYRSWLQKNPKALQELASTVQMLSLMTSSQNQEIVAEGVHSMLKLLIQFNETCVLKEDVGTKTRRERKVVQLVESVQLVTEMIADKKLGKNGKIPVILLLETIKALCRISLILKEQDVDHKLPLTGLTPQQNKSNTKKQRLWKLAALIDALGPVGYLILFGLVAYARKQRKLPNSKLLAMLLIWLPWLFKMAASYASITLVPAKSLDDAEWREIKSRERSLMLSAIFREPFSTNVLKPVTGAIRNVSNKIPLIGRVGVFGMDIVDIVQNYYYYIG